MKTNKLMALLAAMTACVIACSPEKEDPTPDPDPTPTPVEKSKECKLIKLTAVTSAGEFEADIYTAEKVAEFVYLNDNKEALKSVTLKAEISDKATINIEDGKTYDLIDGEVKLTVTAEDGTTVTNWSVEAELAEVQLSCDLVSENVPGKFGIVEVSSAGATVAFCGTDKIATINGEVYDFDAKLVGKLNMEGLPEGAVLLNINNDVNGVIVATVGCDAAGIPTRVNDDIKYGYAYVWKDGYDKAPVCIYNNAESKDGNLFAYMNCGGDVTGDFLLCSIFGARNPNQSFHIFEYKSGNLTSPKWYQFSTTYTGNDGNWGATISPASGSVNGVFFIGDSMGDNKGYHVYTRTGYEDTGEDVALTGTTMETCPGVIGNGIPEGNAQYGNYSTGNIKAFTYNGTPYVIAATTGWPEVYITIQDNQPENVDTHYLLKTQYFEAPAVVPSAAYVYDPATDKGQVLLLGGTNVIARYEITRILL